VFSNKCLSANLFDVFVLCAQGNATVALPASSNIVFALFNAESFDYGGSARMANDMLKGALSPSLSLSRALSPARAHGQIR
jgi:hypothetical protein